MNMLGAPKYTVNKPALELKIARKAALETELKNLSAEIEVDR
jgi:hypothetical protein